MGGGITYHQMTLSLVCLQKSPVPEGVKYGFLLVTDYFVDLIHKKNVPSAFLFVDVLRVDQGIRVLRILADRLGTHYRYPLQLDLRIKM